MLNNFYFYVKIKNEIILLVELSLLIKIKILKVEFVDIYNHVPLYQISLRNKKILTKFIF